MGFRLTKNIPRFFALLPIFAFIPQLIPGGEMVRLALKFGVIAIFLMLFIIEGGLHITKAYVAMAIGLVFSEMITAAVNGDTLVTIAFNMSISVITMLFFYDRAKQCKKIEKEDILKFYEIYAYFILISCLYNLVINYRVLLNLSSIAMYGDTDVASFFDNKNTFGAFLLFGMLAATILKMETGQRKWTVISWLILLNEMMAMCRTAIILSAFLMVAAFLVDNKPVRRKVGVSLAVIIALIVFWSVSSAVRNFFETTLFGNIDTQGIRESYIVNLLPNIKGIHVWVGYGSTAKRLAYIYTGNSYYHNSFLQAYATGGLISLGLLLNYIRISLRYCLKTKERNRRDGYLCLISLVVYCIYSFAEAVVLFDSMVIAMVSTAFVISMPILMYNANGNKVELAQK